MPTDLEQATAALDAETVARLGDTVLYRAATAPTFTEIKAYFDGGETISETGAVKVTIARPTLQVRVADVSEPSRDDRIIVSGKPDIYKPTSWPMDDTGQWWLVNLEKVV